MVRAMSAPVASPPRPAFLDDPFPLASKPVRQDPYPYYEWLRDNEPCHDAGGVWLISRYEDVNALFRDRRLSSDLREASEPVLAGSRKSGSVRRLGSIPGLGPLSRGWQAIERRTVEYVAPFSMIGVDGGDHTRMRRPIGKAFTPKAVGNLEDAIAVRTRDLLDRATARSRFDVIAELGYPLPIGVVAEMLDVPADQESRLRNWSDALSRATDPATSASARIGGLRACIGFNFFLEGLIKRRRDAPGDDLLSELIKAADGEEGLSRLELLGNVVLLIVAGHETTTNLIGNGTLALLRHPDQLELLRERPDLLAAAVEEMLRYDSPGQLTYRTALEPIELHGRTIAPGEQMILLVGSANRDPRAFPEPDSFQIERSAGKNIAFGAGPHFCLGAPLARLEGRICFEALLERDQLALDCAPRYRDNIVHRGLRELWVRS